MEDKLRQTEHSNEARIEEMSELNQQMVDRIQTLERLSSDIRSQLNDKDMRIESLLKEVYLI